MSQFEVPENEGEGGDFEVAFEGGYGIVDDKDLEDTVGRGRRRS